MALDSSMNAIGQACEEFMAISPELHLMCPKTSDDDEEDYEDLSEPGDIGIDQKKQRVEEGSSRLDVTYRCSLILGFSDEAFKEVQNVFKTRANELLTSCSACVRGWHRSRKRFLKYLSEAHADDVVAAMEAELNRFDAERITQGLENAKQFMKTREGFHRSENIHRGRSHRVPHSTVRGPMLHHRVQERRVLKLGEVLPTMTFFLFDEDDVRHKFATTSWSRNLAVTADDFQWAVKENLEDAIKKIAIFNTPSKQVQRFWEGLSLILHALDKHIVVQAFGALDVQPSVYQTLLNHMSINSVPNLAIVLKVFCIILQKGSQGFMGTFANFAPASVAEQVFASPAYYPLLSQTKQLAFSMPEDKNQVGPVAAAWVKPFLESISANQRGDACDSILHHFLDRIARDNSMPGDGREVCYRGAAEALLSTITAFLSKDFKITPSSSTIHTNRILNLSLMLDSRITFEEFNAHHRNDNLVQREITRDSSVIWDAALSILLPGAGQLARYMLAATLPLIQVETFRPKKNEKLSKPKEEFNKGLGNTNEVIGRMIDRLAEFNSAELTELSANPQTIQAIVASLINGDPAVHTAGVAFIKTLTDEDSRSDAILKLVERQFSLALVSFTLAVSKVVAGKSLWSPQIQIHRCSKDFLAALCDPATGVLRSKQLDQGERDAVRNCSRWPSVISFGKPFGQGVPTEDDIKRSLAELLEEPRVKCLGMVKMLRLKDKHLVGTTVNGLVKLFRRLAENEIEVVGAALQYIRETCVRNHVGKFRINTNLDDQQRAELLRALGEDEDDVQIVEVKKADARKKQSSLDVWSRSGDDSSGSTTKTSTTASTPAKHDLKDLTPGLNKSLDVLAQMKARNEEKARFDPANAQRIREKRQREAEETKRRNADIVARAQALRGQKPINAGEGSGLQGLSGIQGKDHAPQKSEIMVGSSSEDEDDSDDDAAFLAQTSAGKLRAEDASKRAQLLKKQAIGPVKKTKIQRSAKDMRARLIPPMDVLHQAILDWDIFHTGDDPPNGVACSRVSETYMDPSQYKQTFLPLLIYEAWQSFATAMSETTSKPFGIKIQNRIQIKIAGSLKVTLFFSPASSQPLQSPNDPHCLARIWRTSVRNGSLEVSYRLSGKPGPMIQLLIPQAEIYAVKITNMTTIEREYASLESLQYYDLMPEILEGKPSPMLTYSREAVERVMGNYQLNQGQAKAILNAKDNDAFTLIQGPPGTGKTKTIVAMVGALMTGTFQTTTGTMIKKPGVPGQSQGASKKLLVCAPSNAAVDELVIRLKQGVKTINGSFHKINVLRLGRSDAINAAVRDVTLDELVKARLEGDKEKNSGPTERQKLHEDAGAIKKEIGDLRPQLEAARAMDDRQIANTLQRRWDELKRQQTSIGAKIDANKDSGMTAARENDILRKKVQQEILDSAQVLCATLSGSGHEMFKNLSVEFETVIIDEAAQCVELSALIPLKYGCSKCILVGDPKQLPPTVLNQRAARFGYDQSLFVRMQRNHGDYIHLLDTQYRMHPEISRFPAQEFYEGKLLNGGDMARLRHQPWHQRGLLGPYRFFDVKGTQEKGQKGRSLVNYEEIKVAMSLYERFRKDNPSIDTKGKFGIITPYKAQLYELRNRFTGRYGQGITEEIEFNTTDAFQGRECEIIIFSCVRASPTGGIGFMTDIRRMNVGLTRAKSSLWVLGDSRALVQGEFWNKLIEDARARDRYTAGNIVDQLGVPGIRLPAPDFDEYSPPPAEPLPPPKDEEKPKLEDVEMIDAPLVKPNLPHQRKAPQLPQTYTVIGSGSHAPPHGGFNNYPAGYAGLDEKGEAVSNPGQTSERPIIHSSGQKRPLGNPEGLPLAKRGPSARRPAPNPMVPRKKKPADPFIQRKPGKPN
ncbi:helicase sen1 [Apiospora phragmitis]|uniref:Helicase sen1 n=1 Tax=Apiospora phragmitis TaxID=2905665 RepID=A0ABR1TQ54_9PEZI